MSAIRRNLRLTMVRPTLKEIPAHPLPDDYRLRGYRPGDEELWVAIQSAADAYNAINLNLFHREFGYDPNVIALRQFYLLDPDGMAIGTSTAWFTPDDKNNAWGRVHWLAMHPDAQGLGLSKPLLSATCDRLRKHGHDKAYLTTSTARIPALRLYWSFGFRPVLDTERDRTAWALVEERVTAGRPTT